MSLTIGMQSTKIHSFMVCSLEIGNRLRFWRCLII